MVVEEESRPFFTLLVVVYLWELHRFKAQFSTFSLGIFHIVLYLSKHERHIILQRVSQSSSQDLHNEESLEDMIYSHVSLTSSSIAAQDPPVVGFLDIETNSATKTVLLLVIHRSLGNLRKF